MTAKAKGITLFNTYAGQVVYIVDINVFHNSNVAALRIEHSAWRMVHGTGFQVSGVGVQKTEDRKQKTDCKSESSALIAESVL